MDSSKMFEYLANNNIVDSFVTSLKEQSVTRQLSIKQISALANKVEKHMEIKALLEKQPKSDFCDSLRDFFTDRGFLSSKQIEALSRRR